MIDGVKCSCNGLKSEVWRNNPALDFGLSVSESTGELLTPRREAKSRSMRFILSPKGADLSCSLAGSLHKYKNADDTNADAFTFPELSRTLDHLAENFGINLHQAYIHSLEVGVNIPLDYSPEIILKNAICHKGKAFDSLDYKHRKLGLICEHTDYAIKLYDKGYQCKIAGRYVLRYEIKIFRQRMLTPFGIATLADLQNVEKVTALIALLLDRLNEIIFFDFSFKAKQLSESKRLNWERYSNPNYWRNLNRNEYYKARKRYTELLTRYGCIDWQKFVSNQTTNIWLELSGIKHKKGRRFPQYFTDWVSTKKATFSNLEYMVEDVAPGDGEKRKENSPEKEAVCCIICGRQLTGQKAGSLFCSERLYGKDAKRCRNKDSNRRLAIKRKLFRAMNNDAMIRVTYRGDDNAEYTDTLGAKEISVTREWLDKVVRGEVLKPAPESLTGDKAKEYLKELSKKNDHEANH